MSVCPAMFGKSYLPVLLLLGIAGMVQAGLFGCWNWEFECKNEDCIPIEKHCNGFPDCEDGSDEVNCAVKSFEAPTATVGSTRTTREIIGYPRTEMFMVSPTQNITATPDSELIIQCRVVACGKDMLDWYRPDGELPHGSFVGSGQLIIPKVDCKDSGTYICYCPDTARTIRDYDVVELEVDRTFCFESKTMQFSQVVIKPKSTTPRGDVTTPRTQSVENPYLRRLPCENREFCYQFCCNGTCVKVYEIPKNTFRCKEGSYVANTSVCNGVIDCPDGSDEFDCSMSCRKDEFHCGDGSCIPKIQECDGEVHCLDGTDESNCLELLRPRPLLLPGGQMEIDCAEPGKQVEGGHVVQLECKFFGRPLPEVKWKKNEGHVPSKCISHSKFGHGVLVCPNFQQSDQGAYSCVGENTLGSAESQPKTVIKCKQITCENGFRVRDENQVESCITCFCSGRTNSCHNLRSKVETHSFTFPRTEVAMLASAEGEIFFPNSSNIISENLKPIKYCLMPEDEVQSYQFMMSYGRNLNLPAVDKKMAFLPNAPDVIITGRGVMLTYSLNRIAQNSTRMNVRFWNDNWLHRDRRHASRSDIMDVLAHLEQIFIRCEYKEGVVENNPFAKVILESAVVAAESDLVSYVEKCFCPVGYDGLSCESCAPGYVRDPITDSCIFQPVQKVCPVGTIGDRCEECDVKNLYYKNSKSKTCVKATCNSMGSLGLFPDDNDECICKEGVTGRDCDTCRDGHFYLEKENPFGCKKCWCSNVSTNCESSDFRKTVISSVFSAWGGFNETSGGNFWLLPSEFSGNLLTSYGGSLRYTFRYEPNIEKQPKPLTVEILGGNGVSLKYVNSDRDLSLFGTEKAWSVPLEEPFWRDSSHMVVSRETLLFVLTHVKAIFIESPYHLSSGKAWITSVELDVAEDTSNDIFPRGQEERALKVEVCDCPVGYKGTSCESCSIGYYRKRNELEGYICAKCECDAEFCNPVRGCEICPKGKYNNNTIPFGSPVCLDCPCNGNEESCMKDDYNLVMCFCKPGYYGAQCEIGESIVGDFQVSISPIVILNKKVGTPVTFNCSYMAAEEHRIEFQKKYDGNSPAHSGLFKVDNYGWWSTLDTTIDKDLGSVDCIVRNLAGEVIARVSARVIGTGSDVSKPAITNCYEEPKYATENEDVYLRCDTTGSPEPEVTWHKADKTGKLVPVNTTDGVHTIPSVGLAMNGTSFMCVAHNSQGEAKCSTLLIVRKRCVLSIRPVNPEVDEGDSIEFNCSTATGSTVVWSRTNGALPLEAVVTRGRLFIPEVKIDHMGEYKCTAQDPYGPSVKTTWLTVKMRRIPPTAEILKSDLEIVKGDSVEVECRATGVPLPKVTWTKIDDDAFPENVRTTNDGHILVVTHATLENSGLYQCRAESFLNATRRILITVVEIPEIEVSPKNVFARFGDTVTVHCNPVKGEPYTSFGWDYWNSPGRVLRIANILPQDAGQYFCTAMNLAGTAREMVTITVGLPPVVRLEPSGTIDVVPRDQVDVECSATGDPFPTIRWFSYKKISLGRNRFHTAVNVLPATDKRLTLSVSDDLESIVCEASNELGTGNATLSFNLKSENPIILGRSKQVLIGTRAELDFSPLGKIINCTRQKGPMIGDECYTENGLEILHTQVQHAGTYKCISKTGEMSYTIKVEGFVNKFTKQGMSYLILPVTLKSQQGFHVEITFKAERQSGFLLLKKKHHAFSMYLKRGKLTVKLRRHSEEVILTTKKSLQLGVWHTAVFTHRNSAELAVYDEEGVAREMVMEPKKFEMNWIINVEDQLYVGGVKASERHLPLNPVDSHFEGCISRLIFDDHEYKITEEGKRSQNVSLCNVCTSGTNPCGGGSACYDAPTHYGFICVCAEGICRKNCMGIACETKLNMCETVKPCGHADNQCSTNGYGLKCKCANGYSGIDCREEEAFEFSVNGNGYVQLPETYLPRNSIKEPEVITIAFTPEHTGMRKMLLLRQGSLPDYLELYMKDDSIVYVYENQKKTLHVSGPIDFSNQYRVEVTRRNNTATMKINGDEYTDETAFSTNRVSGDIYIGGGADIAGFRGCIHEVTINGRRINTLAKDIVRRNIQRKCKTEKFMESSDDSVSANDDSESSNDIF